MTETDTQGAISEKVNDGHGKLIHVKVSAPRSPKPKKFEWDKQMLVADAATAAAAEFGYAGGTPALSEVDRSLDPTLTLHQAGVKDGDELELFDKGGGV